MTKIFIVFVAVSTSLAVWTVYKMYIKKWRAAALNDVSEKVERKQLVHHYVAIENLTVLKDIIPKTWDNYHGRLAELCSLMCDTYHSNKHRVLDVGSGAGGTAFHLSKYFGEVVGIDEDVGLTLYSLRLKQTSQFASPFSNEGGNYIALHTVRVPAGCNSDRVRFINGDVLSSMSTVSSNVDCVLVSNVLTEMKNPREFLLSLSDYVPSGGLLIITDPFLWPEGGPEEKLQCDGTRKTSEVLTRLLEHAWSLQHTTSIIFYVAQSLRVAQVALAEVLVYQRLIDSDSSAEEAE